jgi:hypothetical protein
MLYSYRRINLLERSVIEHGKILQSFILNYNIQMQSINSLYSKNKFENEETNQIKKINLGDKIYVSEDEYSENEYIVNNINRLSLSYRYTMARILVFKTYEHIQTNNGCYILFDKIDEDTINQIYNSLKIKLSS